MTRILLIFAIIAMAWAIITADTIELKEECADLNTADQFQAECWKSRN